MWILCFISPVAPVLKSPRRFLPGSRLTQVMLLQGMVATAAWRQTSRLVRTVGRSLMLSPLAFRNRMTVKITHPPPVRCFHWPSWWSRHWFEWREKGIVYGYPEKAPPRGLYPAKKIQTNVPFTRSGGVTRTPDGRVLYADPRYSVTKCKTIQSQKACNPHTYPHKHR